MAAREPAEAHAPSGLQGLVLAALGIVYGDIGTSPLYTIREAFGEAGGLELSREAILSVLSLIFWSLILIVSVKYVLLILRADNRGEGGVLALSTLAARGIGRGQTRWRTLILFLSLIGLTLFYGDCLITPAISVLSAIEGLETAAPPLEPYVVPLAAVVLLGLFLIQSHGTARVGRLFGPVMLVWFATLAVLGLIQIAQEPGVLAALDPRHAVGLFGQLGWHAFAALGAIVLAVTGAEALYADMGHFGRQPIRVAWFAVVLPGLVLNYFGQGALLLRDPSALVHPFYHLVPDWAQLPLIGLATLAAIIASQAVISGVFSITRQAVQLGYLPRMGIRHTSAAEKGQIYIGRMNWLLMTGVLLLVLTFQTSGALAAAYGIAVTGTMAASAILAGIVAATRWRWGVPLAVLVFGSLFLIDLTYFLANVLKIPQGGWFPLLVAGLLGYVVLTWRRGRKVLRERLYSDVPKLRTYLETKDPTLLRVGGTAVFMTGNPVFVPKAMLHNIRHNKVLHERVVLMTVRVEDVPYVPDEERVEVERLGKGFFRVTAHYGFVEEPDVPRALELCRSHALPIDPALTSYFLSAETMIPSERPDLNAVEERLFMLLSASGQSATAYFRIPPDQVVELGIQLEI